MSVTDRLIAELADAHASPKAKEAAFIDLERRGVSRQSATNAAQALSDACAAILASKDAELWSGCVVEHPRFGTGVAQERRERKAYVVFADRPRVMAESAIG